MNGPLSFCLFNVCSTTLILGDFRLLQSSQVTQTPKIVNIIYYSKLEAGSPCCNQYQIQKCTPVCVM